MFEPLVSIIIPVYNGSDYMREAIDSALAQTYKNLEIIIINDGSSDGGATRDIALSYGDKIRYFEKENGGVSSALNKGIKEMKGEYFSWLSHDDVYYPDKIKKQVEVLELLDKKTLIYCGNTQIDEQSKQIGKYNPRTYFKSGIEYGSREVLKGLLKKNTFNGCGLLIHKKVLMECGMFDESLRFCQDAFMWYKIFVDNNSLFCIDDILVKSRVHSKQLTQTGQSLFIKECNVISEYLSKAFFEISTKEDNFLKLYLFLDAKFLEFNKIKKILEKGETKGLFTIKDKVNLYLLFVYGKFRPYIRKLYYEIFLKIKTN